MMGKAYGKMFLARNWKKYLAVMLLIFTQCRFFQNGAEAWIKIQGDTCSISVWDYIVDFYKGSLPYTLTGGREAFNIPAIWSLYFISFFVSIGRMASRMSAEQERQFVLRCVTRTRWWGYQNQMIWMETAGYVAAAYLAFILYGFCAGAEFTGMNRELQRGYNGLELSALTDMEIAAGTVVITFFVMLAFAYIQCVISLKENVAVGILVSVAVLVCSVFYMHPLLLCNYLMLIRNWKAFEGGMHVCTGAGLSILVTGMMYVLGRILIKNRDLL